MTELILIDHEGEPRVRDLVLGEKLGMARPTNIRLLIERHLDALERFGVCTTVMQTSGRKGGRPSTEYLLNEEQAVYLTTQSDAPNALETKIAVVKTFVAWRYGHLAPASQLDAKTVGGVVKAVVHKELTEAIRELLPSLVEQALSADPRVAAVEYSRAIDVVTKLGAVPKGRRSLSRRAGNRMDRLSKAWGVAVRLSPESQTRMFSAEVVAHWIETEGRRVVAHHNAAMAGQGHLRLVPPPVSEQ